jgi:hypothetical protein
MGNLKDRISSLMKRVAEIEESAESAFFDDPTKKNVRQFAESQAITNKLDTVKKVIETQEVGSGDALIKSQTAIAPPPPEETVKKPGGKELSTLNQFIVKTDEGVKGVPTSHSEINRAKPPVKNPTKNQVQKDLVKKVVERHLSQKDKVRAIKKVLQDKTNKGEI